MRFWKSVPGTVLAVVLAAVAAFTGTLGWRVWQVVHPPRAGQGARSLGPELAGAEAVRFEASDGIRIEAWYLRAGDGSPAVILAPDAGQGKAALLDLAIVLQQSGFHALVLDPRAHGASAGTVATLGVNEKRDVLGALDWLQRREEVADGRIGAFGVGAGAQAVVLAAADRRTLGALVLDGLYPDAAWALQSRVFEGWGFGRERLGFVTRGWYRLMTGADASGQTAGDALASLNGRDVLLIAPSGDPALSAWARATYETLPQDRRSEGNLVLLEATLSNGIHGTARNDLHRFIESFFATRLRAG